MEENMEENKNLTNETNETSKVDTKATETKTETKNDETKQPIIQELQEKILKLEADNKAKDVSYEKLKGHFDRVSSEESKYKKDYQAKLTDEEVKKIELEERQAEKDKEFEEMKNKLATIEATKRYIAFGFDEKEAEECAKAETTNDMDSILKHIKSLNEANLKKKEAEWLNNRPDPKVGGTLDNEMDDFEKGFAMGSK